MCAADEVVSVNGTLLEVTNPEVLLYVSFDCNSNNSEVVVLAHHIDDDDDEELSAYHLNLNRNNCFTAPASGHYVVGIFAQNDNNILEVPTTLPTISTVLSIPPTPALCAPGRCYFMHTNVDTWVMYSVHQHRV